MRDVELLVGVVRMGADRAEHVGKALGDRKQIGVLLHPRRDRHHAADAGRPARADDGVELVGEVRKIEMAMAVDQHGVHAWRARFGLDIAREHRRRRRQRRCPARAGARRRALRNRARPPARRADRAASPADVRHERLRQDRDLPDHLGGDVEHRALPRRIGLGQRPGRFAGEIAVGVGDHRPDRVEHLMQLLRLHRLARLADHGVGRGEDGLVVVAERAGLRQHAAELLADHRQRALRQVAEIVGEVGIDAVDDRLVAVVAVLAERHLAQEEIAQLIDAIGVGQRERVDHVADRLRHLLAAVEQEAVREDAARHLDARPTSGRPANRPRGSARCPCRSRAGRPASSA